MHAPATLATDPRADPRVVAALEPFGLNDRPPPLPLTPASPREELLELCARVEEQFQSLFGALTEGLAPVPGVTTEEAEIAGAGGHAIKLYVHRPSEARGPLPCIVHLHGGGMVLLRAADSTYQRWRDGLAAAGAVVVGVEFRNGGGALGPHPYPAGLDDCVAAARWVHANLAELGASHVVVSGESGGGNLTLALAQRAKREGWIDEIAGVYALCPYVSGAYGNPPADLPSLRELDGYFVTCALFAVLSEVYDPGGVQADDPLCWAGRASDDDLEGLPPHVISVNELDPLRDEGLSYYRRLTRAGVSAVGRVVAGTPHGGDVLLPGAIPDVHAASLRDISGFARALAR